MPERPQQGAVTRSRRDDSLPQTAYGLDTHTIKAYTHGPQAPWAPVLVCGNECGNEYNLC
jgi:hypothetical protein